MINLFIDLILTIFATAATAAFSGLINSWIDIWIVLLLFVAYFLASILLTIIGFFFWALVLMKKNKGPVQTQSKFARAFVKDGCKFVSYLFGARFKIEGKKNLPSNKKKFVIVLNHRGLYDPLAVIGAFLDHDIAFIAKKSLFKIPLINRWMCYGGFLALDREDPKQAIRTFKVATHYITSNQSSMGIFPEGTRNKTLDPLLPFKPGALKIAYKAECPIVVMTINNTNKIRKRALKLKRTNIYINIVKTYQYYEYKDKNSVELSDEIYELMKASYVDHENKKI